MSALFIYIGGEISPALQEEFSHMAVKLVELLASSKANAQDAQLAEQKITELTTLSMTQTAQIAALQGQVKDATDAGFDPALLQQIADTEAQTHSILHGEPVMPPAGFGQGEPPLTTTPDAPTSTPDATLPDAA